MVLLMTGGGLVRVIRTTKAQCIPVQTIVESDNLKLPKIVKYFYFYVEIELHSSQLSSKQPYLKGNCVTKRAIFTKMKTIMSKVRKINYFSKFLFYFQSSGKTKQMNFLIYPVLKLLNDSNRNKVP